MPLDLNTSPEQSAKRRTLPDAVVLILIGAASVAIWLFAFLRPYSLADNADKAWQSLGTLSGLTAPKAELFAGAFALLFGLYWFGVRYVRKASRTRWTIVIGMGLLFNAVLLPMYPVDAADVYDNIIRGRMSAVYGLNPFSAVPDQVSSDPFYRFAAWRSVPSAYGPAWEAIAALTSRIAGDDYTANVIAFKVVPVIGYLLTALLIGLTLRKVAPERALLGAYLFAWNPLIVYSTGQGGHNDTLMTACMALSILFLARRRYTLATLAAVLGALVKFIPLVLVPVIWIAAWRDLRGAARWRTLILSALGGLLMAVIGYAPVWAGPDTLRLDRLGGMFTGSIPTVIHTLLAQSLNDNTATSLVKWLTLGAFGLFMIGELLALFTAPKAESAEADLWRSIRTTARILAVYLLVATTWFQAWYVAWLIVLVAFLDNAPIRRWALVFSYLVTWEGWLYNFISLRYNGWMPSPWRDIVPVAFYMGGAVLFALYLIFRSARRRNLVATPSEFLDSYARK